MVRNFYIVLSLVLSALFVLAARLPETETVSHPAVFKERILVDKVAACTSSAWRTQSLKTMQIQTVDCDSCKVILQGSIDSTHWTHIDSITSATITNVSESSIAAWIRAIISRRASVDTTTVWLYGKNY
jgi:hypothetical protein